MLGNNIDKFMDLSILITMSLMIRLILQVLGQKWIVTVAHTATLVLLPILTYIITNVISGNIALSLGMVGALSIVRFRNPVRSPLELSVYFGAITMGIAASVSLNWLLFLGVSVVVSALVLTVIHQISLFFFRKPFFMASFSEGNSLSSLEVTSTEEIPILDQNDKLSVKRSEKNEMHYVLISSSFDELRELKDNLSTASGQLTYTLRR